MSGVYEYYPEKGEAAYRRAVNLYDNWHGGAEGRITTIMAPKAGDLARPETYLKCKGFAEQHGLRMTTHLSQSWREVKQVERIYGKTPPQHLKDLGVMDDLLTGAHCTYATERDLELIQGSGMGILHCRAVSNPLLRWLDQGIPVGLGTDDYFHDMLKLLRENLQGQKTRARLVGGSEGMLASSPVTSRPSVYRILELATRGGAEALGIEGEVGSLEMGKKADVILVDLYNPYITPTMDPLTSIVLYGTSGDISEVIVNGKILKKDKQITTIDVTEALTRAQSRVEEIIKRFFEDYPDKKQTWENKANHR
jgi:5-methylthioadenosine/S-adenosylhomocysteine deaminase